jgi:hypothetical protein
MIIHNNDSVRGKKMKLKENVVKHSRVKENTEVLTHRLRLQKIFITSSSFTLTSKIVCCNERLIHFLEVLLNQKI